MKIKLEFKEETVYDENANVTFSQLPESTHERITQLDEEIRRNTDLVDIIIGIYTPDDKELTNIGKIANVYDTVYARECRREWDRLWDFFGLSDVKENYFSKDKGLSLTPSEKLFFARFV